MRDSTGLGLKAAKDYVESLDPSGVVPRVSAPITPDADLESEVHMLLLQDKKIQAIKLVRERTGMGLKEAKDYVDQLDS
ncbi:MAG: hypothetical protein HC822_17195 [Oscillochloris sp.]|nr:hypothetical protein [Oscillochloris sp.]